MQSTINLLPNFSSTYIFDRFENFPMIYCIVTMIGKALQFSTIINDSSLHVYVSIYLRLGIHIIHVYVFKVRNSKEKKS